MFINKYRPRGSYESKRTNSTPHHVSGTTLIQTASYHSLVQIASIVLPRNKSVPDKLRPPDLLMNIRRSVTYFFFFFFLFFTTHTGIAVRHTGSFDDFDCPATKDVRSKDHFESSLQHPSSTTAVDIKRKTPSERKRKYLDVDNNTKKKNGLITTRKIFAG